MNRTYRKADRRGLAVVEMAIAMPVLVYVVMGVWEVGRILDVQVMLNNAAGAGARQAATGTFTNAQVVTVVTNYLNCAGLNTANLTVTVSDVTSPSTDVSVASPNDQIQVEATIPYSDVSWGVSGFFATSSTTLTGSAIYFSAEVNPYPTSINMPQGW
ncbi:MAG: TadE/TadG family type IV pilus assembly protein [Thermoguttaceae bacterium]|jgi:Flp pilus assembly protein TadG